MSMHISTLAGCPIGDLSGQILYGQADSSIALRFEVPFYAASRFFASIIYGIYV